MVETTFHTLRIKQMASFIHASAVFSSYYVHELCKYLNIYSFIHQNVHWQRT